VTENDVIFAIDRHSRFVAAERMVFSVHDDVITSGNGGVGELDGCMAR